MSAPRPGPRQGPPDWDELRRRLAAAAASANPDVARSEEDVAAVLERRARALSRPPEARAEDEGMEVVTFARGYGSWAIASHHVRGVSTLAPVAALPGVPPPVAGAVAWKGQILVVIDLVADADAASARFLLVLGEDSPSFGVLADTLGDLRRLKESDIVRAPGGIDGRESLHGITRDAVMVLDGAALIRAHT